MFPPRVIDTVNQIKIKTRVPFPPGWLCGCDDARNMELELTHFF